MIEYEELRSDIDHYLIILFEYHKVSIYLKLKDKNVFSSCLIFIRLSFSKKRIEYNMQFLWFLTMIALKYEFKHIGIECSNTKRSTFAKKIGSCSVNEKNHQKGLFSKKGIYQEKSIIYSI